MPTYTHSESGPRARRRDQGGFVLLTLLFTAAAIAVQLAITLPRAAMEAQRIREEKLIYRGEQYKRAIALYYRKHQKYPQEIDDLEDTNGQRFLRRRYKDPLTGEEEWRVIHMGPDGRFKDSLIYDTEDEQERLRGGFGSAGSRAGMGSGTGSSFGGGFGQRGGASRGFGAGQSGGYRGGYPQTGSLSGAGNLGTSGGHPGQAGYSGSGGFGVGGFVQGYPQQQGFTAPDGRFRGADRARAVRQSAAPEVLGRGGPFGGIPGQEGEQQAPVDPNNPDAQQGMPDQGGSAGQTPDYSTTLPSQVPPGVGQRRGYPQAGGFGASANRPGGRRAGQRGQGFGLGQAGAGGRGGFGGQRAGAGGRAGRQPMGFGGQGAGSQAANIIGQLLTQPRPGGLAGLRGAQSRGGGGAVFKGGIAGVASKAEERGVKIYKEREAYNEWEFVFDYREAQGLGGGMGAMGGGGMPMAGGQPGLSSSRTLSPPTGGGGAFPAGYPTSGVPGAQPGPGSGSQPRPGGSNYGRGSRRSPYTRQPRGSARQPSTNNRFTTSRGTTTNPGTGNPFPGANQQQPGNRNLPPGLVPGSGDFRNQQGRRSSGRSNQQRP